MSLEQLRLDDKLREERKQLEKKLAIAIEALEEIYECGSRKQSEIISRKALEKMVEGWKE